MKVSISLASISSLHFYSTFSHHKMLEYINANHLWNEQMPTELKSIGAVIGVCISKCAGRL
jgi:hypothetical protein